MSPQLPVSVKKASRAAEPAWWTLELLNCVEGQEACIAVKGKLQVSGSSSMKQPTNGILPRKMSKYSRATIF